MARPPSDLERIARLRELFLAEDRGDRALADYWRDVDDLAAYDAVLGARIGWKWDAALAECAQRGFARADDDVVVDFGCGAGIAARRFAAAFGAREVLCHDRSAHAMAFAVARLVDEQPGVRARAAARLDDVAPDVLLASHVLGELDASGEAVLRDLITRSRRVVLVEPGNRFAARRLLALRDDLLAAFHVVAPCPHRARCPALANDGDWCHFFAPPPPEVFTAGDWVRTARTVGIDLRALPYAFVALDRAPPGPPAPPNRALGRAAVGAHDARLRICSAAGLSEVTVSKRTEPQLWRMLKKGPERLRPWPPEPHGDRHREP